jgi:hypothetical protein
MLVNCDLPALLEGHCSNYKITAEEIEFLFEMWVRPFNPSFKKGLKQLKSEDFLRVNAVSKNFSCIEPYFSYIFFKTDCPYQFSLIHKILSSKTVQQYLCSSTLCLYKNFPSYLFVLLLGLADTANMKTYMEQFPFEKVFSTNIKLSLFFNFHTKIKLGVVANWLFTETQWSYFLRCLLAIDGVVCKELYYSILDNQEIAKVAAVRAPGNPNPNISQDY